MSESPQADLPAHVRRLWGLEAAPPRGPRPTLRVSDVVSAAVEVADAEGLDGVSMARVASQLGFTTMALYRHVDSKDELLQLMVDHAAGEPPDPPEGEDWRAATRAWTDALFEVFRRHPWAIQVPVRGIPIGPHHIAWAEAGMAALRGSGLDAVERIALVSALTAFVRADVSLAGDLTSQQDGRPWHEVEREHGRNLQQVLDPNRFPEMAQVVEAGLFSDPEESEHIDTGSSFALELLLDGIEAHAARRTPPAPRS